MPSQEIEMKYLKIKISLEKKHENFNAIHVGIYSMYHFIGNINHVYK